MVIAAVSSGTFIRYQYDISRERDRIAQGSQLVQTPCGPIEYAIAGTGTAVLVVHGAGGGFDQGIEFGVALVRSGFQVIAMSRFGYLRTPLPRDASATAQADAHRCLLDSLKIERAVVIGASAGAPSAMQFALRHPDRSSAMVLLVPAAYVPRPGNQLPMKTPRGTQLMFDYVLRSDFLFWAATRLVPATLVRSILATPPAVLESAEPAERTRIRQMMNHILPVSARRPGLINDVVVTSSLQRYELEKIHTPTLVISALDDLFGTSDSARYSAEHMPGARLITYATGGHMLVGHQEDTVSQMSTFLHGL